MCVCMRVLGSCPTGAMFAPNSRPGATVVLVKRTSLHTGQGVGHIRAFAPGYTKSRTSFRLDILSRGNKVFLGERRVGHFGGADLYPRLILLPAQDKRETEDKQS